MKIQSLISGLLFMSAIVLLANENKTNLFGKIEDHAGFGIISGSVEIYSKDADCKLIKTIKTAENGTFSLASLPEGEYEIVAKAQGFDDKVQTLKIGKNAAYLGTIQLTENDIALDEVIIYGKALQKEIVVLEEAVIYGKAK